MALAPFEVWELNQARITNHLASILSEDQPVLPTEWPGCFITHISLPSILFGHLPAITVEGIGEFPSAHFVDDSPQSFMRKYESILQALPERVCVFFTVLRKSDEPPSGGWRWHKWGEYLGEFTPQREYLYNEPIIEQATVVNIVAFPVIEDEV